MSRADKVEGEALKVDAVGKQLEGGQDLRGEVLEAIEKLKNCTSQEAADEAALAFCYVNSKSARKRLVRSSLT